MTPFAVLPAPAPTPTLIAAVAALAALADTTDGAAALSEHTLLALRHGGAGTHLVARWTESGEVVGYAHLGATGAEWVVHPLWRRRGIGRALATAALAAASAPGAAGSPAPVAAADATATPPGTADAAPGTAGSDAAPSGPVSAADTGGSGGADGAGGVRRDGTVGSGLAVWAHGDHPAASALALRLGFARARELWQLRRRLTDDAAAPELPAGVRLRAYVPDADDAAWLALNARAFASHPEQGAWTADDLAQRRAEPWFDPAGFLLAERVDDGALVGFHWTKMHPAAGGTAALGEVYVLGVDPAANGRGLGRALTLAGLHHLRGRGLDTVLLYVDEANAAAVRLYTRLGFVRHTTDVQYRH
ncbi:mycothiol synthase [Pilimelia anulata]|uniref:mycothiol synthase n=1 Tax=Pilimelia anulata TaxID=53371 RepID=UPI001E5DD01F|nr:mycothiol synthase [Pilimelia anulata]